LVAAQSPSTITFEQLLNYVELEVKEEKILKMLAESPTTFTLGEDQIDKLKKANASEKVLKAVRKATSEMLQESSDIRNFVIVLDASASMRDETQPGLSKWESAKRAAADLINSIPNQRSIAFIVYGNDVSKRCASIELLQPLTVVSDSIKANLIKRINTISPSADTPIGASLQLARSVLAASPDIAKVILITDGMESCKGDPINEAGQLAAMNQLQGGVDVIGLGLKANEIAEVEKIARAGRGKFHDAQGLKSLQASVAEVESTIVKKPEPVKSKSRFVKSDVKPSKDLNAPTLIEPFKYISGRLGESKAHYVTATLPAGEYIAMCEFRPASGASSNIIFNVASNGNTLIGMNEIDRQERGSAHFNSNGSAQTFTIENRTAISDYNFVIYPAGEETPLPSLDSAIQRFESIAIGQSVNVKLDPKSLDTRDGYYQVQLDEGDYEMTFNFTSPKSTANYGAKLDVVNADGMKVKRIESSYDSSKNQAIRMKMILAEEELWRLRIRTYEEHAPIEGSLNITKIK